MKNSLLEIKDDLGLLDPNWTDWRIRRGMLYDPLSSATIGFRPEEIRALPYLHQLVNALQRDVQALRATAGGSMDPPKPQDPWIDGSTGHGPRQLTTLSRPAQTTEKNPRHDLSRSVPKPAPFAFSAPVPVRIALGSSEGQSRPAQDRSRK